MLTRKSLLHLLCIPCLFWLMVATGLSAGTKGVFDKGVTFQMGTQTIYVMETVPELNKQVAIIPFELFFDPSDGPPPAGTIASIEAKIEYDTDALEFIWAYKNDIKWTGDFSYQDINGIITLTFTAGAAPPLPDPYTYAFLEFKAKCQPELTQNELEFHDVANDSYLYVLRPDMLLDKYIPDEAYSGYVNIDNYIVKHSIENTTLTGILGKRDTIPVFIENNALLWGSRTFITFDPTRLAFVGGYVADGDYWLYMQDFVLGEGTTRDTVKVDLRNWINQYYPQQGNKVELYYLVFDFLTPPAWDGGNVSLNFIQDSCYAYIYNGSIFCPALMDHYENIGGTISISNYTAQFKTTITDMIFPADITNGYKLFWADVSMKENFTAGGADNRIIVNFDLGENFRFQDISEPVAGVDSFKFQGFTSTGKSTVQELAVRQRVQAGLGNIRGPINDFAKIFSKRLMLNNIVAPSAFENRFVGYNYKTTYSAEPGFPAYVKDFTGTAIAYPGDNSMTWDNPKIEYAVGQFYAPAAQSNGMYTAVYQNYYVRHNQDTAGFRVKIREAGPHGMNQITLYPGVEIVEQGSDYVILQSNAAWSKNPVLTLTQIARIKYVFGYTPAFKGDNNGGDSGEKDSQPPVQYCYKTTYIYFEDYEITDNNMMEPTYFVSAGTVRNRYDCSVIVNPEPGEIEPWKGDNTPTEFALFANRPNPFNPTTSIAFDMPVSGHVNIEVFNILGQKVATLVDEVREAGHHEVIWNANGFGSGVFLYRMTTDGYQKTQKMLLMK